MIGVFVFIVDATSSSKVPVVKDNKIMLETRSQIPDMDMIKASHLFINRIESSRYLICIPHLFHIENYGTILSI